MKEKLISYILETDKFSIFDVMVEFTLSFLEANELISEFVNENSVVKMGEYQFERGSSFKSKYLPKEEVAKSGSGITYASLFPKNYSLFEEMLKVKDLDKKAERLITRKQSELEKAEKDKDGDPRPPKILGKWKDSVDLENVCVEHMKYLVKTTDSKEETILFAAKEAYVIGSNFRLKSELLDVFNRIIYEFLTMADKDYENLRYLFKEDDDDE